MAVIDVRVMTGRSALFFLSEAHVVCPCVDPQPSTLIHQLARQIVAMIAAQQVKGISSSQQLCASRFSLYMWFH